MKKFKKIISLLIAYVPFGAARVALYRCLSHYRIGEGTRIGLGVVICVDRFDCGKKVTIMRGTTFMGPISVRLGDNMSIGRYNKFECGDGVADPKNAHMNYAREFIGGEDSLVNEGHLFDLLGRIELGKGSWVAGFASQFLTHGASVMDRDIRIGDECFLGSAVRFSPGSSVGNRVIVGMGAVVTKSIPQDNVLVVGLPAKVMRERTADDIYEFKKTW